MFTNSPSSVFVKQLLAIRIELGSRIRLSIQCWAWRLGKVGGEICTEALVVNLAEKLNVYDI
jgi:hypothetical protein